MQHSDSTFEGLYILFESYSLSNIQIIIKCYSQFMFYWEISDRIMMIDTLYVSFDQNLSRYKGEFLYHLMLQFVVVLIRKDLSS